MNQGTAENGLRWIADAYSIGFTLTLRGLTRPGLLGGAGAFQRLESGGVITNFRPDPGRVIRPLYPRCSDFFRVTRWHDGSSICLMPTKLGGGGCERSCTKCTFVPPCMRGPPARGNRPRCRRTPRDEHTRQTHALLPPHPVPLRHAPVHCCRPVGRSPAVLEPRRRHGHRRRRCAARPARHLVARAVAPALVAHRRSRPHLGLPARPREGRTAASVRGGRRRLPRLVGPSRLTRTTQRRL
jgi:hypothetical protein